MASLFPVVCVDELEGPCDFYLRLLGMKVVFQVDWYVQLQDPADPTLQIAFVSRAHESVPAAFRQRCQGVIVTLERDDVDGVHARARELGLPVHTPLRDEPWGQRHFITEDPAGLLVDVVKLIPPDASYADGYLGDRAPR